jgi:putative restriction endonuclease
MNNELDGWRHIEFSDVPNNEDFRSLTLDMLSNGVGNSDRMRDQIRQERRLIVSNVSGNWRESPSGTFVNAHAWALEQLVVEGVIVKVAEKEYQLLDNARVITTVVAPIAEPNHSPIALNQLEMALRNNGYHIHAPAPDGWLAADATFAPGRCFVAYSDNNSRAVVGTSLLHVGQALIEEGIGETFGKPLKIEAAISVVVPIEALHAAVRRIFELSRSLPTAPLGQFQERTRSLPITTEAERLVVQRIGQDVYRTALMDLWSGRCALTGLDQPELLRASHMKPWAQCENDSERLDPMNGLLLAAQWDLAFDAGLVTFEDDGTLISSNRLTQIGKDFLVQGSSTTLRLAGLKAAHLPFLRYHRKHIWKS